MAKGSRSQGSRLSAEERLLEKQQAELLRRQRELQKKLTVLPVAIEAQEEQRRSMAKKRAMDAGPAISFGRTPGRPRQRRGRALPSRERFSAQLKTGALILVLAIIVILLLRQLP